MVPSLEDWFKGGERIRLELHPRGRAGGGSDYHIFCRVQGTGPWLTFLHGFPTCSWDWAWIAPALQANFRLLTFDFLGFGDSDKPAGHDYSLFEQADLTAALWRHLGVAETGLVAHDYGATVALELLSRQAEARPASAITRCVLMNAGLYIDLQRPVMVQKLLQVPVLGSLLDHFIGEQAFAQQFSSVFSPQYSLPAAVLHQYWEAITRRSGVHNYHRLIYYLTERRLHQARWEGTLESAAVPTRFLWGLEDPVSGKHIAEHIHARLPSADLVALPGVGHYPQLEVPETVASQVLDFFAI